MNKRNLWIRIMAFALALVMILTSHTVSSMGGTLSLKESPQPEENEAVQPIDLRDERTYIRVTGDSGALPPDTVMTTEPLAEDRMPESSVDAVNRVLAKEDLTVQDRAFYDISMNGKQPSGSVRVWLPISDEWDGVLDAWYTDDEGNIQNIDEQKYNAEEKSEDGQRYYVFDADCFGIYGMTVSAREALNVSISSNRGSAFIGDQVTLSGALSEEGAALQWQYKTKNGEWQDIENANSVSHSFEYSEENEEYEYRLQAILGEQTAYSDSLKIIRRLTLKETVELYYGENGSQDTASVSVRLEESGTSFKAGDTVTMVISYKLQAAALYNYGDQAVPMFDTYNDTKIRFKLPEGMSLPLDTSLDNVKVEGPTENNVYTFVLNKSINALSDGAGSFLVNVKIDDNGKMEANHIFDFGEVQDFLKIETKFSINGAESAWPEDLKTIIKEVSTESPAPVVTSATDDEWMIEKTADGYTVSEDRTMLTVHYKLAVGLKGADGKIVTNQQTYGRVGRVPFEGDVMLTETPTVNDREGNPVQYKKITIKTSDGTQLQATGNGTYVLPIEKCGDHKVSGVDKDAPYYSVYTVDVEYPAEKFIARYSDLNQSPLTVNNSAELSYRLKGINEDETSYSNAEQKVSEVIPPAMLTINKYIVNYADGSSSLYSAEKFPAGDPVSGPVTFKVTGKDGTVPLLYKKNADGTYTSLKATDGLVTIHPADTTGVDSVWKDGMITVYLDAGTYVVSETDTLPSNTAKITADENKKNNAADKEVTIAEEGSGTADFYNRETLGSISIDKKGKVNGVESDLMGAAFGLYRDSECTDLITSQDTDNQGNLKFDRLTYGTYYVKEISAPTGYIRDKAVYPITLTAEDAEQTVKSVNLFNNAYVKLQKKVFDIDSKQFVDVDQTNYQLFADRFTLQRKTADADNWETLETGMSLGQNGTITRNLPAFDTNGKLYTYRFAEKLPDGCHGDGETTESGDRLLYSGEFTLDKNIGNSLNDAVSIEMKNWRNGSIDLTKKFWNAGSGGMAVSNSDTLTACFDLYYREGSGTDYKKYNTDPYTVAAGKTVSITDLPRTTGTSGRYYYLVETSSAEGYELSGKTQGFDGNNNAERTTINVGGQDLTAYGPFNFTDGEVIRLQQSITFDNVEQKVPVVVEKSDSYTGEFVDGAEYTIYEYDGNVPDHKGVKVVNSSAIPSGGSFVKLDPGKKYVVEETKTPEGYENITDEQNLIINLENIRTVDTDMGVRTVTLKNRPDPKITIEKKTQSSDGKESVTSGVIFGIYVKHGSEFVQANGYDGQPLQLGSGSQLQLPAGTYYLREEAPDGVLDPSKYESLYQRYEHEYKDGSYYFGPYEIKNQKDVRDLGTIINYSEKGEVRVTKYGMTLGGTKAALSDAEISIYREGEDAPVQTLKSAKETGYVTFKDLPIYDEKGQKITYIIRETKAPDGYTESDKKWKVQLSAGQRVTTDMSGAVLELINQPETSLRVRKVYYNIWENQFTNKEYLLSGAEIALYRLNGDVYEFAECQTTNSIGEVVFTGLSQKNEYVAVEVSIPDIEEYKYLEPIDKKQYLEKADGMCPAVIRKKDIDKYNIVTKSANTDENKPQSEQTGRLINVENWTQIRVEKYAVGEEGKDDAGKRRELNNAEFELYRQIVDPRGGTELSFDSSDPNTTLVGSYTSGTLYDANGIRQDGYFATDILKSGNDVVYWLVEKAPGIGGIIKPENAITMIRRSGTDYTNKSTYEGKSCSRTEEYQDNKLTDISVENDPAYGGGVERYSTVRIAKWAGSYTEDGEKDHAYTPLGNASFDLYLAAEDGTLVEKIDTLTTGLDNDLSEGTGAVPSSALASSRAFSWTALTSKYQEDDDMYRRIFHTDEKGNGYARAALVETDAPDGYTGAGTAYYMYMFFRSGEDTQNRSDTLSTESFNDVFYVKDQDAGVKLAEDQDDIVWGLYATEENETGGYDKINISGAPEGVSHEQYRLVNWSVDNFAVTVRKYGYEPAENKNTGMTSEELDSYYSTGVHKDRVPLENVTMRLERMIDGRWETYAYSTYDGLKTDGLFKTDRNGYFAFPRGLDTGQYRIVEVAPNVEYVNIYDLESNGTGSDYTGDEIHSQAAYYFDVIADNVEIRMYNPKKLTLDIQKKGMNYEPISDVTFSLTGMEGISTAVTGPDGKAHLTGIENGTYKLSETVAGGHTNEYLKEYFKEAYDKDKYITHYGKLNNLVNGNGIFFGYKTKQIQNEDGSYGVTVTAKVDISDYGIETSEGISLMLRNPETQDLTVTKTDTNTPAKRLSGAEFKIEYQRFPVFSGDVMLTDSGWSSSTGITGTDGLIKLTGQEPGVYKITEISAPDGYDITDPNPRYVALTGGMDIKNVTVDGTNVIKNTDPDYGDKTLTFADAQQVKLTVNKNIVKGDRTLSGSSTFTFRLYNENKQKIGDKTVTCTNGAAGSVEFTGLSQGKTYYLQEIQMPAGYELTAVKDGQGDVITSDGEGYYAIKVPETNSDVTVTAENTYLYAELSIRKVDGEDGTPLSGAEFNVYDGTDGVPDPKKDTPLTGITFTENAGLYTARIPLTGTDVQTFYIFEKTPPDDYLKDESFYIKADLTPGQKSVAAQWKEEWSGDNGTMLANCIFPNYRGAYIDLIKYGNVREGNPTEEDLMSGVTLMVCEKSGDNWIESANKTTDTDGRVHFTVVGGKTYAVAEPSVCTGWKELQGIWAVGEKDPAAKETVQINGQTVTLHKINGGQPLQAGTTYSYNAYNTPYVEMEIRKQDALNYKTAKQPTAVVSVYEIEENAEVTDEFVAGLLSTGTAILEDIRVNRLGISHAGTGRTEYYNYANSSTWTDMGSTFLAGRTYLVVETCSSVSMITDNSRVEWYQKVTIPEGTREKTIVTLRNIEGNVTMDLAKTSKDQTKESLFAQDADLEYTIRPSIVNTYPLDSFTLMDSGLTAYHGTDHIQMDDRYLNGRYSITEVIAGKAEHDASGYIAGEIFPITAEVTFYGFDGQTLGTVAKDISTSAQTFTLAEAAPNTENAQAKTFTISYHAKDLEGTGYVLGTNFKPGDITVKARVERQAGGEGIQSIDLIRNSVTAEVKYTPWKENGEKDTQAVIRESATADVKFSPQDAAVVTVEKKADRESVALNSPMTYSITLRNDKDADAAMEDPFIVDLLPQGTTWVSGSEKEIDTNSGTLTFSSSSSGRADGETAVYVNLDGFLKPGEYVTIKVTVDVGEAAAGYGTRIQNYVLVGSETRGAQSDTNPQAASFKNENGDWAESMDKVLTSMDETRKASFREILRAAGRDEYGYISATANANWTTSTDVALVKSGCGDRSQETGFTSDQLSTVSNGGWMRYRLTATNTSSVNAMSGISMIDILPKPGDYRTGTGAVRGSDWGLNYGSVDSVSRISLDGDSVGLMPGTDYKIYYYRGNLNSERDYRRVYNDAKILKFNPQEILPEGWSTTAPDTDQVDNSVRAFAVAFSDSISLVGQKSQGAGNAFQSIVVEYTAKVEDFDTGELQDNAYDNAVNSFACHYSQYTTMHPEPVPISTVLGSNVVSNTILQAAVKVGGKIWIDKNADGQRQDDESINKFQGSSRILNMLQNVEIRLYRHNNTTGGADLVETYDKRSDSKWLTNANYIFDGLDPAKLREDVSDDEAYGADGKTLNVSALKGTDPAAYMIAVTLPSENVAGKFEVTEEGATNGRSYHPDHIPAKEQTDSNFTVEANANISEMFYLWPTDKEVTFDNTKDIGIIPLRDLEITKKAADGEQPAVAGAEFRIYGPFAENADEYDLTDENLVNTVTTGEDGKAVIEDLRWYQKYVIVETSAPAGYIEDGAEAAGGEGTNITPITLKSGDPAWVLGVPNEQKTTSTDQVTVTDKRIVEIQLGAEKSLKKGSADGTSLDMTEGVFTFCLKDDKGKVLDTKTNSADGKVTFDKITVEGVGTFIFYISENVPKDAVDNVKDGITYDPTDHRVIVRTKWTDAGLKADYQYEDGGEWSDSPTETTITNVYNSSGSWMPEGTKKLTGRDMAYNETFYFAVVDGNGAVVSTGTASGGKDGEKVDIQFTPISYDLDDADKTFTYTIKETDANSNPLPEGRQDDGMIFDQKSFTVNVQVTDTGKGTIAAIPSYPDSAVAFENRYAPEPAVYSPQVKKVINSAFVPEKKEFTFNITNAGITDGVKMPENTSVTVSGSGKGIFDEIEFTKAGTYTFEISETDGKIPGYDYDDRHWTLTVVVGDSADGEGDEDKGQLVVSRVSYMQDVTNIQSTMEAEFTNTYTVQPDSITPQAEKVIEGSEYPQDNSKVFTFCLTADISNEKGGASLEADSGALTTTVTGEGMGSFDDIVFYKPGVYRFCISEDNANRENGYTYDEHTWTLTVTVIDDNSVLSAVAAYSQDDTVPAVTNPENAVFTNIYAITGSEELVIPVEKTVTGDVPEGKEQTFTFTINRAEGNPEGVRMPEETTAEVTGSGKGEFGAITFEQSGVYSFEIREENGGAAGYSYDGNVWTVTVKVVDRNGILEMSDVVYARGDEIIEGAGAVAFENSYDPAIRSVAVMTGDGMNAGRGAVVSAGSAFLISASLYIRRRKKGCGR